MKLNAMYYMELNAIVSKQCMLCIFWEKEKMQWAIMKTSAERPHII